MILVLKVIAISFFIILVNPSVSPEEFLEVLAFP